MNNLSAEKKRLKLLLIIVLFLPIIFSVGCGGSSSHGPAAPASFFIKGSVKFPDDFVSYSIRENAALGLVKVFAEQFPEKSVSCDSDGNFTLELPPQAGEVNLVAQLSQTPFYIQRTSPVAVNNNDPVIINLERGIRPLKIKFRDSFGKPAANIKCSLWGNTFFSDYEGEAVSFLLPASINNVEPVIKSAVGHTFTPVLNLSLGDICYTYEFTLPFNDLDALPPVLSLECSKNSVKPGEIINITAFTKDPSGVLPGNYKYEWSATSGGITPSDSIHADSASWKTPDKAGLATVTVSLQGSKGFKTSVNMIAAVGGSDKINECILSFSPLTGAAGQNVVISGRGFGSQTDRSSVDFGGALGTILMWKDNCIKVQVPRDAETACLIIKNNDWTLTTDAKFNVIDYKVTLSPDYGIPGAEISLKGYGFGDEQGSNRLELNGDTIKNITLWKNKEIRFKVSKNMYSGILSLIIRDRERQISNFTVTRIKKFDIDRVPHLVLNSLPSRGIESSVTINGDGFCSVDESEPSKGSFVSFPTWETNADGTTKYIQAEYESWSSDKLEIRVPRKAVSGPIKLTINNTEMLGPFLKICPSKGYDKDSGVSFGDTIGETQPVISDVCILGENVVLADISNNMLWYINKESKDGAGSVNLSEINKSHAPLEIAAGKVKVANESSPDTYRDVLYVSDNISQCVLRLKDNGDREKIAVLDKKGSPRGLCTDEKGRVFVSDANNHRIIIYNEDLIKISEFGSKGWQDGCFDDPEDVFFYEQCLYVADKGNSRIQCFKETAENIFQFEYWLGYNGTFFGKHGINDGFGHEAANPAPCAFSEPTALWVKDNFLYTADVGYNFHCIQKINLLDPTNAIYIGSEGNNEGQYRYPDGLFITSDDEILVADSQNSRVQMVSTDGVFIGEYKPDIAGKGISFCDIAFFNDEIYILDGDDCSVSVFDSSGAFEKKIGSEGSGRGQLNSPSGIAVNNKGDILVADTGNMRIVTFCSDGEIKNFGVKGSGDSQFMGPEHVFADSEGRIFVSDWDKIGHKGKLALFESDGSFISLIGEGIIGHPGEAAFTSRGDLLVADTDNHRVCMFSDKFVFKGWFGGIGGNAGFYPNKESIGESGSQPGHFMTPVYLSTDFEDCLYVSDPFRKDIQKLNVYPEGDEGIYICNVPKKQLNLNFIFLGIFSDENGCLYVTAKDSKDASGLYFPTSF